MTTESAREFRSRQLAIAEIASAAVEVIDAIDRGVDTDVALGLLRQFVDRNKLAAFGPHLLSQKVRAEG